MNPIVEQLQGTLCVSAQAYPGEPMRDPRTMAQIAQAAVIGGAASIRAQGLEDVRMVVDAVDVPVVGLWKDGKEGVFITPTLFHAQQVAKTGCAIIALDGTLRERPDGRTFTQTVTDLRQWAKDELDRDLLIMADCDSLDSCLMAEQAGADFVGTTLSGYTDARPKTQGPDFALVEEVVAKVQAPIVVEGRIHTPDLARQALDLGAHMVCAGTAITHPSTITSWFLNAINA